MRLHELAKKLGVSSKEIMDACRDAGFECKSHFMKATPDVILAMNKTFGGRKAEKVEVEAAPAAPRRSAAKPAARAKKKTAKKATSAKGGSAAKAPTAKKRKEEELDLPRSGDEEGGESAPEAPHVEHHAHRHKRADFRHRSNQSILPAEATLSDRYADQVYGRQRRGGSRRRRKRRKPNAAMLAARAAQQVRQQPQPEGPSKTSQRKREVTPEHVIELQTPVTPRDLSSELGMKLNDIIRICMNQGLMININEPLPEETVELIALEKEKEVRFVRPKDIEDEIEKSFERESDSEALQPRSPVIAFLGHVDHGKTSLLDHIRTSRVVDSEAGGITQHIGAYRLTTESGTLCFLDTPGHEAFSSMRARGADLTDIVVLVVAADDGVMPQTREAYAHAKAAGTPVVVAINKCDLPNANPQRAVQELANLDEGLLPEDWGGKTGMIECSAATGDGMDELVERILLEAELLELKADPERPGEGHVLEAELTSDRGVVANLLVQDGTLRQGDVVLAGAGYGKVKFMFDEFGKIIDEAGPATPVSISGLNEIPEAGDKFYVVDTLARAREVAEKRDEQARARRLADRRHVSLGNLTEYLRESEIQELRVVLKADVSGTLEVLKKSLADLATDEVKINVIHEGVGGVNQADVILADASDAIVIGFHVAADPTARQQAEDRRVEIKIYHIIYRLIEDMKAALSGLLPPEEKEVIQGHAEVREIFKASRLGNIAGCMVTDGVIHRTDRVRVFRDNVVIHEGRLASLQRFKDQAREVREGYDCGLRVEKFGNFERLDVIEAYTVEEVARSLE